MATIITEAHIFHPANQYNDVWPNFFPFLQGPSWIRPWQRPINELTLKKWLSSFPQDVRYNFNIVQLKVIVIETIKIKRSVHSRFKTAEY